VWADGLVRCMTAIKIRLYDSLNRQLIVHGPTAPSAGASAPCLCGQLSWTGRHDDPAVMRCLTKGRAERGTITSLARALLKQILGQMPD